MLTKVAFEALAPKARERGSDASVYQSQGTPTLRRALARDRARGLKRGLARKPKLSTVMQSHDALQSMAIHRIPLQIVATVTVPDQPK